MKDDDGMANTASFMYTSIAHFPVQHCTKPRLIGENDRTVTVARRRRTFGPSHEFVGEGRLDPEIHRFRIQFAVHELLEGRG